ncbi:MAG: metalloregulator ArsR/SmtB family transcription factor [Myxococcota bacterium]
MKPASVDLACRALQDPTRRQILEALRDEELPAGQLARRFPLTRPAISKHLRVLREAQLVRERRDGRQRIYRLDPEPLRALDDWLGPYRLMWAVRLHDLKDLVEREARSKGATDE